MVGMQIPILVGIFEYGIILAMKKYQSGKVTSITINVEHHETNEKYDWNVLSKILDKWTFLGASVFIMIFNIIYWSVALNLQ